MGSAAAGSTTAVTAVVVESMAASQAVAAEDQAPRLEARRAAPTNSAKLKKKEAPRRWDDPRPGEDAMAWWQRTH